MSLYASMNTAISGLTAQARALGNVADNVANSQTTGFKRTDTSFVSYITKSTQQVNQPGSVIARPDYTLTVQGTVMPSDNPLAMAIAGQGMFSVSLPNGKENGQTTFDPRNFYTRAGDFNMNKEGYLVNGQGYYLQGWASDSTGAPDRTSVQPLRVEQSAYNPVPTGNVDLKVYLPIDDPTGLVTKSFDIYDTVGGHHSVDVTFTKDTATPNQWAMSVVVPDDTSGVTARTITAQFGIGASPDTPDGTLGAFDPLLAVDLTPTTAGAGMPASVAFTADFGQGPQSINLNFGEYGAASGLKQYESGGKTDEVAQDGVPLGGFSSVSLTEAGDMMVNYDNGQSRTIGRVPIVSFADPDKLQKTDGQAFLRTPESGDARVNDPSSNGSGKIVTSSLEGSNVDLATEFSKLILAQRAYSANTKIVTVSDELLQDTLNMRR